MKQVSILVTVFSAMLVASVCTAAEQAADSDTVFVQEGDRDRGRGNFNREEFQQRIEEFRRQRSERMREEMGFDEKEWKEIVYPMVEDVQSKQRNVRTYSSFGGRGGFGGRGSFRGRGGDRGGESNRDTARERPGGEERELTDGEKRVRELRDLVESDDASADNIKKALGELRAGREKAEKELAESQKKLREVVTVKQEAQFVLAGVLN